ncbi:peptide-methionine (S)-S-oxide reductase MsrA [Rubripirellula tenax]|uniref:peptide-methionine (S)-S-oxide reductase MsrA n=1 Tax=Rubripirellula tenax TaxID=2528015 RepID=UPI0036F22F40
MKIPSLFRASSPLDPHPHRRVLTTALAATAVLFGVVFAIPGDAQVKGGPQANDDSVADVSDSTDDSSKEMVATLAGGCFWCTEAVFERMEGVQDVVSGYIGGKNPNPSYEQVCTGRTGHAEAVEIYYDPAKVKFEELLEVFFKTHDPTTLNRQGADSGTQYRSTIFYHNAEQKRIADAYITQLDASEKLPGPIVTTLEEASKFFTAEEYHQDYYARNPNAGYCQAVVRGKVDKFDREFADKRKSK